MQLGPYTVLEELGRGGQGVVLRARGPDGGEFALKLLGLATPQRLERFAREQRLLGTLEGGGFVPLVEVLPTPRGPCLVMPFLSGGTLRQRLERGPLAEDEALRIGRELAASLGRAHRAGIVHRDLKPENVLFDEQGRPLVADLGLGKHYGDEPGTAQLSRTGEMRGTLGYMAPEQQVDAKHVGPPADVYALGALLYEMLGGVPPPGGDARPLAEVAPRAAPWVCAVVDRCLSQDPAARWPDGAALAAGLSPARSTRSGLLLLVPTTLVLLAGVLAGALLLAPAWSPTPPAPADPPAPQGSAALTSVLRPQLPDREGQVQVHEPVEQPPAEEEPPRAERGPAWDSPASLGLLGRTARRGKFGAWELVGEGETFVMRNATAPHSIRYANVIPRHQVGRLAARVEVIAPADAGKDEQTLAGVMWGYSRQGEVIGYQAAVLTPDGSVSVLERGPEGLRSRFRGPVATGPPRPRLLELVEGDGGLLLRVDGREVSDLPGLAGADLGREVGVIAVGRGTFRFHSFAADP